MPRSETGMTQITLAYSQRDSLKKFKLRIAGEIGKDFPMGALLPIMVEICQKYDLETIALAKDKL